MVKEKLAEIDIDIPNLSKAVRNEDYAIANEAVEDIETTEPAIKFEGNIDTWNLLYKCTNNITYFTDATYVCNVSNGCLVRVTTNQRNPDGSYSLAETVTFVPGNHLREGKLQRM